VTGPQGTCDPAFTAVRDVFAASLADGDDLGAAVTVVVDGRPVVDLWGGVADERTGRAWAEDTACVTFSATKAVTAAAALHLAERGRIDLDARVTDWWPGFGAHGKEAATGVHLLSHQAGLPAFAAPVAVAEAADPAAMADRLAGQAPDWTPGTDHGYHAVTFGWLAGEIVRRAGGRTVGDYVRAEFGPELAIGVPAGRVPELARIKGGRPLRTPVPNAPRARLAALAAALGDPDSPTQRSMGNPSASFNDPALLTAGWPAAGLVCTARALAGFYRRLVDGELLRPDTVHDAVRVRAAGPDRTMLLDSAFGLGFMRPSSLLFVPPAAQGSAFGHPGASGALGLGDLDCGLAFGYVPNLYRPLSGDPRAHRLLEAAYACL
jgi:CubicO group peptidase (beta-lactamase class C family)